MPTKKDSINAGASDEETTLRDDCSAAMAFESESTDDRIMPHLPLTWCKVWYTTVAAFNNVFPIFALPAVVEPRGRFMPVSMHWIGMAEGRHPLLNGQR